VPLLRLAEIRTLELVAKGAMAGNAGRAAGIAPAEAAALVARFGGREGVARLDFSALRGAWAAAREGTREQQAEHGAAA
jgi:hypothetical protein